jgi:transcriptional regulator with XRE-family HTH domain
MLRREKGISQKQAASELGISQALLSHYEKGIRECGLDFVVRAAEYYSVSCDYLLGRSADRSGLMLMAEDIPEPEQGGRENAFNAPALAALLNKKLLTNSLHILFDILAKAGNRALTMEVSKFLMVAVYRMFRIVYSMEPKNQEGMFSVPKTLFFGYASACMQMSEANAVAISGAQRNANPSGTEPPMIMNAQYISEHYPLFATSLFNLIKNAESHMRVGPAGN